MHENTYIGNIATNILIVCEVRYQNLYSEDNRKLKKNFFCLHGAGGYLKFKPYSG